MTTNTETCALHKQAASDHSDAAKSHLQAAECLEKNNVTNAKEKSKAAMSCSGAAHKSSTAACKDAVK